MLKILKEMWKDFKFFGHDIEETTERFKVRAVRPLVIFTAMVFYISVINSDL